MSLIVRSECLATKAKDFSFVLVRHTITLQNSLVREGQGQRKPEKKRYLSLSLAGFVQGNCSVQWP